ncbi:hypothetical protein MMAG44476_23819 [Mycolicibacterium mageritense DSM 44476 = CIP 104973]|uniref:Uncharacterized protein n=1 Tax=Mycolicibacterium mageritense TaxID=53462 RepID=A0AAI8TVD5_MYCME|nr:hypothetical protein [Mycolicibacterium mageritense]MBN3457002.1 hypothetical protein [Mycobacterium sp. DSM 3803]OKH77772.1 hypothetical protein EB73_41255 [Mycobacterium sp. SWH-M3]MCC9179334.1 hypothetical protein [Mycolicibacterium mageritense]TXI57916.1 MAG: hypothetical protein E6Q55_24875 [Mycolicibacterium mageritense]BBX34585.1 hypothetical protein MMAGJ_38670 [Mycolicibacterium mageritense]
MSAEPPSPPLRATIGFWVWLTASVLLIVGGLFAAAVELPGLNTVLFRGTGVLTALGGAAMAYLAGRSRTGEPRFRRAALALSMALVVVIGLTAALGVVHILTLLGVLLLIAGTILNARVDFGRNGE